VSAVVLYAAAVAEIADCFRFWAWLRLDRSPLWIAPGIASLIAFAWLLTRIDADFAGRAYAAYGGVYRKARRRGCDHPHAIRILARAWIRVLWRTWIDGKSYNPERHAAAKALNLVTEG
jgi:hypothetical protein